jgi:hypothetical protein
MPYMMSDLTAGSTAVRQLQQNAIGSQYDAAAIAAGAEETQLKLEQDRLKALYAPQEAALKIEQEQKAIEQTRLSNLINQSKINVNSEKKAAILKATADPEYSKLSPADQSRKLAAAVMGIDSADGERFTKLADSEDSKSIINSLKQHEDNRLQIGNALATIRGATDDQMTELINKMPDPMKTSIKANIPGFFEQTDRKLQRAQLEALMNNGEGKNNMAANEQRLAILDLQIQKAKLANEAIEKELENIRARGKNIAATRENIEETGKNIKSKGTAKAGGSKTDKQDEADAKREDKQYGQFRRDASRIDFEFKRPVQEATDAFKKAVKVDETKVGIRSYFGGGSSPAEEAKGSDTKRAELASTKAWRELQELKQEVVQRKLNALEAMPEGKQKDRIYDSLQAELESIDTMSFGPKQRETKVTPIPVDEDKPPPAKSTVPSGAKTHDGYPARKNADGSYSTEVSITVTNPKLNGGKPTNIPSLWKGKEVDEDTAVKNALASGKKYDSFSTIPEAVAAAKEKSKAGGAGATSNKPGSLGAPPKDVLDKANAAIAKGANPEQVLKRLQDKGYDVQFTKEK